MIALDRLKLAFDQAVQNAMAGVDFHALYTCQVVSQNADGTLDLMPSGNASAALPSQKNIPIKYEKPGVKITVQAGAQVLLGWQGGDPAVPYAALWATGTTGDLQSYVITAAQKLSFVATAVNLGQDPGTDALVKGTTYRAAEDTWFQGISTFANQLTTDLVIAATAMTALAAACTTPPLTVLATGFGQAAAALAATAATSSTLASALASFQASSSTYLSTISKTS